MLLSRRQMGAEAVSRVHPVYLMIADSAYANPQTKPIDLGCESAGRMLPPTSRIAIGYYYST